jgi:hypothetical protein
MGFRYSQSTGSLLHNGALLGTGYSGHGAGLNNPSMQNVHATGPLPQGLYIIRPPSTLDPHLGPLAMPLEPYNGNTMFLRGDFFIHGDNAAMNHTASDGCIIMAHEIRQAIAAAVAAGDNQLEVTA